MTAGAADDAEIAARATAPDGWRVGDVWSFYVERLTTHDDAWARIPMPPAEAPVAPRLARPALLEVVGDNVQQMAEHSQHYRAAALIQRAERQRRASTAAATRGASDASCRLRAQRAASTSALSDALCAQASPAVPLATSSRADLVAAQVASPTRPRRLAGAAAPAPRDRSGAGQGAGVPSAPAPACSAPRRPTGASHSSPSGSDVHVRLSGCW